LRSFVTPSCREFVRNPRRDVLLLLCACVFLTLVCWASEISGLETSKSSHNQIPTGVARRSTQPTYSISAGIGGDIFPVLANYASLRRPTQREWGFVAVKITNSTDSILKGRLAVRVPRWSDQEFQLFELSAGRAGTFLFAPSFSPRFYENRKSVAATALVTATDAAGREIFSGKLPVILRSTDDMYWGDDSKYAQFVASWVTPRDREIERIVAKAAEFVPSRYLPGYDLAGSEAEHEKATYLQAQAIYRTLQRRERSSFGSWFSPTQHDASGERVRMPFESLQQESVSCINGAVVFASLFENLGMDPVVILVPGHAYVGVRVSQRSQKFLLFETSLTRQATFADAVLAAERVYEYPPTQVIRISIREARSAGIFPMPSSNGLPDPKALPIELAVETISK
jgi:hypothetical protein